MKLTIRGYEGRLLLTLVQEEGPTGFVTRVEDDGSLRETAERWIQFGLSEWVGEGDDVAPRETPSSSPDFLPRIKAYVERQFSELKVEILS